MGAEGFFCSFLYAQARMWIFAVCEGLLLARVHVELK